MASQRDSVDDSAAERPLMIREDMLAQGEPPTRIDFEQHMPHLPRLSIGLIVVNAIVFAWEANSGALANAQGLIAAGALQRERVVQGEAWRLLSAMFLHANAGHLIGNCIILYIVGMACEHAFGWWRSAVLYLLSGLWGSLLSATLHAGPSVGASGAIFGVVGAVVVFFYRHQRTLMLRDKRIGFVLLVWAFCQISSGLMNPFIDNFAHIGGFCGGAVMALFVRPTLLGRSSPTTA